MARKKRARRGRPVQAQATHRIVAEKIRARIQAERWPLGGVLPSLRALAHEYGVGERVIRLAVEILKEEDRVYVNARRRLAVKRPGGAITATEGLVLEVMGGNLHTYLQSPHVAAMQRGLEFGAGDLWAPLLIVHDEHLRNALPDDLLAQPLRGIVLLGQFTRAVLERYERLNVPVVLADRPGARWKLHALAVDNEPVAFEATRRLIALGHRRIAFLRFVQLGLREIDPDSKERQAGFTRACREAGLAWRKDWVFNSFSNDTPASASIQALLHARPRFSAAVAVDEGRARLLLEAARAAGIGVPRELSVVCFQTQPATAPRIAGPRVNFFQLGRRAMRLLEGPKRPFRHERRPAVWAPGETLGPALKA